KAPTTRAASPSNSQGEGPSPPERTLTSAVQWYGAGRIQVDCPGAKEEAAPVVKEKAMHRTPTELVDDGPDLENGFEWMDGQVWEKPRGLESSLVSGALLR